MTAAPKSAELLACPWCHSTDVSAETESAGFNFARGYVECLSCRSRGPLTGLVGADTAADLPVAHVRARNAARAAWNTRTAAQTPAVEGWQIVPVKLTQAMLDATCATAEDDEAMRNTWIALLSASPPPPSAGAEDGCARAIEDAANVAESIPTDPTTPKHILDAHILAGGRIGAAIRLLQKERGR